LATDYYKFLFGPGVGNIFEVDPDLWKVEEKVTILENEELTKPFCKEEIKVVLFEMEKIKLHALMDYL
jgi:hypothetical protein